MNRVFCLAILIILTEYTDIALGDDEVDIDKQHKITPLVSADYYVAERDDYVNYDREVEHLSGDQKEADIVVLDSTETRNYKSEINAGNMAETFGTNPAFFQPDAYPDFSRRFVLQYPYTEVLPKNKEETEKNKLTPILASPELVLDVARESAMLEAGKPNNPTEDLITKDILRTGNYWNGVWKEDVDPRVLRSKKSSKLEMIRTEVPPESKLYDLVSKLKQMSPTLLYVINQKR